MQQHQNQRHLLHQSKSKMFKHFQFYTSINVQCRSTSLLGTPPTSPADPGANSCLTLLSVWMSLRTLIGVPLLPVLGVLRWWESKQIRGETELSPDRGSRTGSSIVKWGAKVDLGHPHAPRSACPHWWGAHGASRGAGGSSDYKNPDPSWTKIPKTSPGKGGGQVRHIVLFLPSRPGRWSRAGHLCLWKGRLSISDPRKNPTLIRRTHFIG